MFGNNNPQKKMEKMKHQDNNTFKGIMKADGHNGQIELYKDRLVIKRKGFMSKLTHGFKGSKEIRLNRISSIQLKEAGMITSGYIQFSFSGGKENTDGLMDATKDENSVVFTKKQQTDFKKIKTAIYNQMDKLEKEKTDRLKESVQEESNSSSDLDELEKLADLKDKGIITEEEFKKKKKQILDI